MNSHKPAATSAKQFENCVVRFENCTLSGMLKNLNWYPILTFVLVLNAFLSVNISNLKMITKRDNTVILTRQLLGKTSKVDNSVLLTICQTKPL